MANQEDWMNRKWRPAMGWTYMIICILDFAVFPIGWSVLQAVAEGTVTSQWDPLTLKGAGLFHMAMGAILGIAAWSRGQEKIASVSLPNTSSVGSVPIPMSNVPSVPTASSVPQPKPILGNLNTPPATEDPPYRNTRND